MAAIRALDRKWSDLSNRGGLVTSSRMNKMKAATAFLNIESTKLPFLLNVSPQKILEMRNSDNYRFRDFRRKWLAVCSHIERMPWEKGFRKEANQLWDQEILPEVNRIKKDLREIKIELGGSAVLTAVGVVTTFIPGLTFIGLAITLLSLFAPTTSIPKALERAKEIKKDQKNDTYFMIEASHAESIA